jgi:4'-phosphopantetheinyl transferase
MIDVFAVNMKSKMDSALFNHLISSVSEEKQERIRKFRKYEDAQRTLIGDVLARRMISDRLGIKNKDIFFEQNEFGKPFLKHIENFHFNTSHAGEWITCATHHLPLGVDVEYIQPIEADIAKRFFSEEEYYDLMNLDELNRSAYFYELWTLKESYIKAEGKGLSIPLNYFSFKIKRREIDFKSMNETKQYCFMQYDIDRQYKMAVCGLENNFSQEVKVKSIDELYF